MKQYVKLFEQFSEELNEAKVKPFLNFAIDKDNIKKQLKKKKTYWFKKNGWSDWKRGTFLEIKEYAWDFAIKISWDHMPKPEVIQSKDFGLYQISNINPSEHETMFDKKGQLIKVSRKSAFSQNIVKKEVKSMKLKTYNDSEAMDMLMDYINSHDGLLQWINQKAGEDYDVIDAADWLYNQYV